MTPMAGLADDNGWRMAIASQIRARDAETRPFAVLIAPLELARARVASATAELDAVTAEASALRAERKELLGRAAGGAVTVSDARRAMIAAKDGRIADLAGQLLALHREGTGAAVEVECHRQKLGLERELGRVDPTDIQISTGQLTPDEAKEQARALMKTAGLRQEITAHNKNG